MAPNRSTPSLRAARYLGALLLIAAGAVHLQQYFGVYYRVIPVIGPLFMASSVIGLALGLALLAPIERLGRWAAVLVAAGGIAFAAGTIAGLEISDYGMLFGFHEHGYRLATVLSIVFEGAAIVLLGAYACDVLGLPSGTPTRPRHQPCLRRASESHTDTGAGSGGCQAVTT